MLCSFAMLHFNDVPVHTTVSSCKVSLLLCHFRFLTRIAESSALFWHSVCPSTRADKTDVIKSRPFHLNEKPAPAQMATECWWDVYGGRWMPRKERKPSSSSSSFVLLRSLQLHPSRGVKRVERIYLFISKEDEYYLYPEGDRKAGKKHILLSSPFFFYFFKETNNSKNPQKYLSI